MNLMNESYWTVVAFGDVYNSNVFKSVDKTLMMCNYSNESYWVVLACGEVYSNVKMKASTF